MKWHLCFLPKVDKIVRLTLVERMNNSGNQFYYLRWKKKHSRKNITSLEYD